MNRTKLIFIISILLQFVIYNQVFSQGDPIKMPDVIPPSPTAYELGKYGQIPVGLFTGTPNVNLPLYTYKTKNLAIPISLSYSSSGIKVDQMESNVGLGWSLNAGGVISRIARDGADEESQYFYPEDCIENLKKHDPLAAEFFYAAGEQQADTETDLFMFNCMGISGKFVYDNNKNILLIPHQDIEIINYSEDGRHGFMITTSGGIKYIFLDNETTKLEYIGAGHQEPNITETAWYLTKIIHPLGDIVEFGYTNQGYNYITSKSQTLEALAPSGQYACNNLVTNNPTLSSPIENKSTISGRRLVSISSNNPLDGTITIASEKEHPDLTSNYFVTSITVKDNNLSEIEKFTFDYSTTSKNRTFLTKVQYKDPNKSYQLDYIDPEGLTQRLSFNQDHWGFYNGNKGNTCLVPKITDMLPFSDIDIGADREPNNTYAQKGLLSKVKYPTKGYTEIEYEANTHYGTKTIPGHMTDIGLIANTGDDEMGSGYEVVETLYSPCEQRVQIFVAVSFNRNECDPNWDTDHSRATLTIENAETGQEVVLFKRIVGGGFLPMEGNIFTPGGGNECYANLKEGSYTITLTPSFECVQSSAGIYYMDTEPQSVVDNIEVGGSRVKKTISFDPVTSQSNVTRYYYSEMGSDISSGDPGQKAHYVDYNVHKIECATALYDDVNYALLSSNSLAPLINTGSNNIYYEYVTISHGGDNFENGGEQHKFIINRDVGGKLILGKEYIQSAPRSNTGWNNGLEKSITIFKKAQSGNFITVKEIINHYTADERYNAEVKGFSVRKNYEFILSPSEVTYECQLSDLTKTYSYSYCAAPHWHEWLLVGTNTLCIAEGSNMQTNQKVHPCYGKTLPYTHVYTSLLDNLDIMEYKNISYWNYLDNTTTIQYDLNGQNPITSYTNYHYDNPTHLQLSRTETSNSGDAAVVKRIYYPDDDLVSLGFSAQQITLIKQLGKNGLHRISEPVQTEQLVQNKKNLTTRTLYKNWYTDLDLILPEELQSSTVDNALETRIRYYNYDEKGNPLEVAKEGGTPIVYLWGNNYKYPIAKIENNTYTVVMSALGISYQELQTKTNEELTTLFENLREHNDMKESMITSYIYKPLVGISSITDPNGINTTYNYDEYGRLSNIKDNKGKILKELQYNYAKYRTLSFEVSGVGDLRYPDGSLIETDEVIEIREGEDFTFELHPANNYHVEEIIVDGISKGDGNVYTISEISEDTRVEVRFKILQLNVTSSIYTEDVLSTLGGTISPSGDFIVDYNSSMTFNFNETEFYHLADVKVNGSSVFSELGGGPSYELVGIKSDKSIEAYFEENTVSGYVRDANGNGIEGVKLTFYYRVGSTEVKNGTAITDVNGFYSKWKRTNLAYVNVIPEKIGWTFAENGNLYNYTGIREKYKLTVLMPGNGSGTTSIANDADIYYGDQLSITANPAISSLFMGWGGDYSGSPNPLVIDNVTNDITIAPIFTLKQFDLTTSIYTDGNLSSGGGIINPSGNLKVNYGSTPTFLLSPYVGYTVSDFKVNGISRASRTLDPITSNHTVSAYFEKEYVTGYVRDANGNGIEGVKLTFYYMDLDHNEISNGTATTDANGFYRKWKATDRAYVNIVPVKEFWTFVENGNLYNYVGTYHPPTITLSTSSIITLDHEETTHWVNVTSNTNWTVSADQTWIHLSTTAGSNNGSFYIGLPINCDPTRTGMVTVSGSGVVKTISVKQRAIHCKPDEERVNCFCRPKK